MACSGIFSKCCGRRIKQLLKKSLVVSAIQIIGWFTYTYIEEGFPLTDCIFNQENVRRLKLPVKEPLNDTSAIIKLYKDSYSILGGDVQPNDFEIYYSEFKAYFNVVSTSSNREFDIEEVCRKWYSFSVITLTTVGYGNIVPKTKAGKLLFFPYCLIGIPAMLFFLNYVGELLAELCNKIVECLSLKIHHNGQHEIVHKELKSFVTLFTIFWIYIIFQALHSKYFPENEENRLQFVDGIYFYFVSFATIGYGDITSPTTGFLFEIWLYIGLCLMSGVVNSALEFSKKITESRERAQRKRCCCSASSQVENEPKIEMLVFRSDKYQNTFGMKSTENQHVGRIMAKRMAPQPSDECLLSVKPEQKEMKSKIIDDIFTLNAIKQLKNQKPAGADKVPLSTIKDVGDIVSEHLSMKFNSSLANGIFSEISKLARVTLISKSGVKKDLNN